MQIILQIIYYILKITVDAFIQPFFILLHLAKKNNFIWFVHFVFA